MIVFLRMDCEMMRSSIQLVDAQDMIEYEEFLARKNLATKRNATFEES